VLGLLDLDPNIVKPGWLPLLITLGLAAVMVLLFFSLRKQFRRIDVSQYQPTTPTTGQAATPATAQPTTQPPAADTAPVEGPGPKA
jgi:hypothetical protein